MAEAIDLVVDRAVLLDVGVARRDVRLGLVVVVVRHEVLDSVLREELAELVRELRGERLVGCEHERRSLHLLDRPRDRGALAAAGDAEKRLEPAQGHRAAAPTASSGATGSRRCSASPARARAPPSPGPSSRCSGPRWSSRPTSRWPPSWPTSSGSSSPRTGSSTSSRYYDYYQPEAYMPVERHVHREGHSVNDEIDRLRHSATSALLTRRDIIVVASVSCIYGLGSPEEYRDQLLVVRAGRGARPALDPAPARRHAVRAQRHEPRARQVPGARRHHRGPPRLRRDGGAHRAVRRRDRAHHGGRPAHRRAGRRRSTSSSSSRPPTTSPATSACARPSCASRPSCRSGSPSSSARASCSRPSACACAPSTTSR